MSRDDEVTKVPCMVCKQRRVIRCTGCDGSGVVTPDEQARQRLQWPDPPPEAA